MFDLEEGVNVPVLDDKGQRATYRSTPGLVLRAFLACVAGVGAGEGDLGRHQLFTHIKWQ